MNESNYITLQFCCRVLIHFVMISCGSCTFSVAHVDTCFYLFLHYDPILLSLILVSSDYPYTSQYVVYDCVYIVSGYLMNTACESAYIYKSVICQKQGKFGYIKTPVIIL